MADSATLGPVNPPELDRELSRRDASLNEYIQILEEAQTKENDPEIEKIIAAAKELKNIKDDTPITPAEETAFHRTESAIPTEPTKEIDALRKSTAEVTDAGREEAKELTDATKEAEKDNKDAERTAEKERTTGIPATTPHVAVPPDKSIETLNNSLAEWEKKYKVDSGKTGGLVLWHYPDSKELSNKIIDSLKNLESHESNPERKNVIHSYITFMNAIHKVWSDDLKLSDEEKRMISGKTHSDCIKAIRSILTETKDSSVKKKTKK